MTRDRLAGALLKENIETKKYFHPPLHQQALFRPFVAPGPAHLPVTEAVAESVLSLPIYDSLPAETVRRVAWAIRGLSRPAPLPGTGAC